MNTYIDGYKPFILFIILRALDSFLLEITILNLVLLRAKDISVPNSPEPPIINDDLPFKDNFLIP